MNWYEGAFLIFVVVVETALIIFQAAFCAAQTLLLVWHKRHGELTHRVAQGVFAVMTIPEHPPATEMTSHRLLVTQYNLLVEQENTRRLAYTEMRQNQNYLLTWEMENPLPRPFRSRSPFDLLVRVNSKVVDARLELLKLRTQINQEKARLEQERDRLIS